jgi:hypothetical protein
MSPKDDLSSKASHYFDQARTSIFVAAYTVIGTWVHHSLSRAHRRGVNVEVVVDAGPTDRKTFKAPYTIKRVLINEGSMHQKFALIDDKRVLFGSWNFNGAHRCHNTLMLVTGPLTVTPFIREAKRLRKLDDAPDLLRGEPAQELLEQAVAIQGWSKFLTLVNQRLQGRGWLTVREEAALRRIR